MVNDIDIDLTKSLAKLIEADKLLTETILNNTRVTAANNNSMHSASAKINNNEYQQQQRRTQNNKIAKSYDLMRVLQGDRPIYSNNDDVSSGTDGLRYYSGSKTGTDANTNTNTSDDKVRKSYELMRLIMSQ